MGLKLRCLRASCRDAVTYRFKVICNGQPQYAYCCDKHAADMGYRAFHQPFQRITSEVAHG